MTDAQIIVLATPVFFALIGLEYWIGLRRGRNTYRLNDAVSSIALGMLSQVVGVLTKLFTLGIYTWVFERAALTRLDAGAWWVWLLGLLLYDFLYYWHHRLGHTTALLWAAHAVHHQSEDYNLSTALRQTGSGWLVTRYPVSMSRGASKQRCLPPDTCLVTPPTSKTRNAV